MTANQLKILLIEDNPGDTRLIQEMLRERQARNIQLETAGRLDEGLAKLTERRPDVILLDLGLPDSHGLSTLAGVYSKASDIPIVVLTGFGDEAIALEAVKKGAQDYLVKDEVTEKLLFRSIQYAMDRQKILGELKHSRAGFTNIVEKSGDGMLVMDCNGSLLYANPVAGVFFRGNPNISRDLPLAAKANEMIEVEIVRPSGELGTAEMRLEPTEWNGQPAYLAMARDITRRKRAEMVLRESEANLRAIFDVAQDLIFIKDRSFQYTHVNPAAEAILGLSPDKIVGKRAQDFFDEEASRHITELDRRVLDGEWVEHILTRNVRGVPITFHEVRVPMRNAQGEITGLCCIARDVTDRRRVENTDGPSLDQYPSEIMAETVRMARVAAATDSVVLLLGESGSGKDYLAKFIHDCSKRSGGPFFSINCAAVPPDLAESELFGHERGAFTGAQSRKRGLLELAEGGTLLLNEIGELSLHLQAKLLTFLDSRQFTRVGGEQSISIDARLIAATNRDLQKEVEAGLFRQDLFYRINVISIHVPPLRKRRADIPKVAEEILSKLAAEMQLTHVPGITTQLMAALRQYDWPGNVRELRNVLERALMLWDGGPLDIAVPFGKRAPDESSFIVNASPERPLGEVVDEVTRIMCTEALQRCNGNKKEAARILQVSRDSLYRYLKRFGIEYEDNVG